MRLAGIVLAALVASLPLSSQEPLKFDHLEIRGNTVVTTHSAGYKIEIDKRFAHLGEFHHQPVYGEKQFDVSLAAFRRGGTLILIHAETHTDGSGGLDYSDLKSLRVDGLPFTSKTNCATSEDAKELDSNPEIAFIRSKGFEMALPFVFHQIFATSSDGKAEVVIGIGSAVKDCDELAPDTLGKELEEAIDVSKREVGSFAGAVLYSRIWLPGKTECRFEITGRGIVLKQRACGFYDNLEPGTKFEIVEMKNSPGRTKLEIRRSGSPDRVTWVLKSSNGFNTERLFSDIFSSSIPRDYGTLCGFQAGKATSYDVFRSVGFPTDIWEVGNTQEQRFGLEYQLVRCAGDYTFLKFKSGILDEMGFTV